MDPGDWLPLQLPPRPPRPGSLGVLGVQGVETSGAVSPRLKGLLGVCTACGTLQFSVALTEGETVWSAVFREKQTVASLLGGGSWGGDIFH